MGSSDRLFSRIVMGNAAADSNKYKSVTGTVHSDPWSMIGASLMAIEWSTEDGTGALEATFTLQRNMERKAVDDPTKGTWRDVGNVSFTAATGSETGEIIEVQGVAAPAYRLKVASTVDGGCRVTVHTRGS